MFEYLFTFHPSQLFQGYSQLFKNILNFFKNIFLSREVLLTDREEIKASTLDNSQVTIGSKHFLSSLFAISKT